MTTDVLCDKTLFSEKLLIHPRLLLRNGKQSVFPVSVTRFAERQAVSVDQLTEMEKTTQTNFRSLRLLM